MCEMVLIGFAAVAMYKVADMDDSPGWLWAFIALIVGFASVFLIPLPYLRILIALVVTFVAMMVVKAVRAS